MSIKKFFRRFSFDSLASSLISLLLSFVIGGLLIWAIGTNPFQAYYLIGVGAVGTMKNLANTLASSIPLIFAGLAVAVSSKAGLLNLGVEGQLYMGAMAATLCGLYLPATNRFILLIAIMIASMLGGMLWALIPGVLKAKFGTHEVIVAIMLNYVAELFTTYLIIVPFREHGSTVNQTAEIPKAARLSKLFPRTQLTTAFILAVIVAIIVWFLLRRTTLGFKISAVGGNRDAARAGGINPTTYVIIAMLISGAIASFAGTTEVVGKYFRFRENFSPGFGFTGLAVAVLARNNPFGVIATSILFGGLSTGCLYMSRITGISGHMSNVIQSIIILLVSAPRLFEIIKGSRKRT